MLLLLGQLLLLLCLLLLLLLLGLLLLLLLGLLLLGQWQGQGKMWHFLLAWLSALLLPESRQLLHRPTWVQGQGRGRDRGRAGPGL